MLDCFASFPIKVDRYLAGLNKAVKLGGVVFVSPEVWSLMRDSSSDELEHLLRNLPLLDLDTYDIKEIDNVSMERQTRTTD